MLSEVLGELNLQYEDNVGRALLKNENTKILSPANAGTGIAIATQILDNVQTVLASRPTAQGADIAIVGSTQLITKLVMPVNNSAAPMDYLRKGLTDLGVKEANISFEWKKGAQELFVSDTDAVHLYTHGVPKVWQSGSNSEGNYNFVQFLFSSVQSYIKQKNSLVYQVFEG